MHRIQPVIEPLDNHVTTRKEIESVVEQKKIQESPVNANSHGTQKQINNMRPTRRDFAVQIVLHTMIILASLIRWQIMSRLLTQVWFSFPLHYALMLAETFIYQLCFDYVEGRWSIGQWDIKVWLYVCLKPAFVNTTTPILLIPFRILPQGHLTSIGDFVWSFLHSTWRVVLFEIGIDLSYYTRHKVWHTDDRFVWVHKPHHTDTGKHCGHLVTYETYVATWAEEIWIGSIYVWGYLPCYYLGLNWNWLDVAIATSYISYGEQWLHAGIGEDPTKKETFFSRYGVLFWRIFTNPVGINITAADHAAHHKYYSCNFAKRYTLWDKLLGTYRDYHQPRKFLKMRPKKIRETSSNGTPATVSESSSQ